MVYMPYYYMFLLNVCKGFQLLVNAAFVALGGEKTATDS